MVKLYLVRGRAGVGKSGVCEDLSLIPNSERVYFEQFITGDDYESMGGELSDEINSKILDAMFESVSTKLQKGVTVILEGMCEEHLVERYRLEAQRLNVRFVSLVVERRHESECVHPWIDDPILREAQNNIEVVL